MITTRAPDGANESVLKFIIVAVSSITDAALEPATFEGQHHPHSCEQLSSQFGSDIEGLQRPLGEVFYGLEISPNTKCL